MEKPTTPEPKARSTWDRLEDFVREHVQRFIQGDEPIVCHLSIIRPSQWLAGIVVQPQIFIPKSSTQKDNRFRLPDQWLP